MISECFQLSSCLCLSEKCRLSDPLAGLDLAKVRRLMCPSPDFQGGPEYQHRQVLVSKGLLGILCQAVEDARRLIHAETLAQVSQREGKERGHYRLTVTGQHKRIK